MELADRRIGEIVVSISGTLTSSDAADLSATRVMLDLEELR